MFSLKYHIICHSVQFTIWYVGYLSVYEVNIFQNSSKFQCIHLLQIQSFLLCPVYKRYIIILQSFCTFISELMLLEQFLKIVLRHVKCIVKCIVQINNTITANIWTVIFLDQCHLQTFTLFIKLIIVNGKKSQHLITFWFKQLSSIFFFFLKSFLIK